MTDWQAEAGDEVEVGSRRPGGARRRATILEVLGGPGHEYYRVRWRGGSEAVFHPGPDAVLVPRRRRRRARPAGEGGSGRPPAAARPRRPPKPAERPHFRASPGDRLVIRGHHLGEPDRDAEILEVRGRGGGPPYWVRWSDSGREGLLFPGADAAVEHFPRRRRRSSGG